MMENKRWTLTELDRPDNGLRYRITLAADDELVIEIPDASSNIDRYVFDKQGELVNLSHERHITSPLFKRLASQILETVRKRCL